ncbi:hypothetical protein G6F56_010950 [Rhizopus delemar]|nr:hypothetical protein G6F56_010950 [Rhizopus delemar]
MKERLNKDIYRHIVQQHAFKEHILTNAYFSKCSEMSNTVKFWGPVLESYFGEKEDLFIQWGDTFSIDCKSLGLESRLDLRIIMGSERGDCEALTGEFTSTKTTTKGKLYTDKLKSVLASKFHLNAILQKLTFLPSNQRIMLHQSDR